VTLESIRALRFGGRLLVVGWAATPNVGVSGTGPLPTAATSAQDSASGSSNSPGRTRRPNTVPTNLIMMKGLHVIGCPAMIAAQHDPGLVRRRVTQLEEWFFSGALPPPVVGAVFEFARAPDALALRVASGSGPSGATIVRVGVGSHHPAGCAGMSSL
jgi:NADPH:quinone reductase-like Zn-dependent oxidoreductase